MNSSKIAVIGTSILLVLTVPLFTKCSSTFGVENRVGDITNSSDKNILINPPVVTLDKIELLKDKNYKLKVENVQLTKKIDNLNIVYKKQLKDANKKNDTLSLENREKLEEVNSEITKFKSQSNQLVDELSVVNKKNRELLEKNRDLHNQINSLKDSRTENLSLQNVKMTSSLLELAETKKMLVEEKMKLSETQHQLLLVENKGIITTKDSDENSTIEQIEIIDIPQN